MSEAARHRLLITLVHGTWPGGLFPKIIFWRKRRPLWFEENSPFLARLNSELGDISHDIKQLRWSGKNSIRERDRAAQDLARRLSAEHAEHPEATQLIIAHSHGGNIALRALHLLQQRDSSQSFERSSVSPLVATLATPFVEVHRADFGKGPSNARFALIASITTLSFLLGSGILPPDPASPSRPLFSISLLLIAGFTTWYWVARRATARTEKIARLSELTRLGRLSLAQAERLLVIRAVDDEASLTMALGTILNYATVRVLPHLYLWVLPLLILLLPVILALLQSKPSHGDPALESWHHNLARVISYVFIITLFGVVAIARTVHGSELAVSPMECQINTQSTPDAIRLSKIVTLVRHAHMKSLRHGIYEHEECAKAISDWVRSQLCSLPLM